MKRNLTSTDLRIGTRRADDRYEGVLRDGTKIVLACGHRHHNRDESSRTNGRSARHCIRALVMAARFPEFADSERRAMLAGPAEFLRAWGTTASQAQRMHEAAARQTDEYMASLPAVADLIGNRPVFGYTGHVEIAPLPPQGVSCRHCGTPLTPANYSAERRGWVNWRDGNRDWVCAAPGATSHEPPESEVAA